MNITKELAAGQSKIKTLKIIDYVGDNPIRFKVLVDVYLKGPYRITQRAAWPLTYCVEQHPKLIEPHLKLILNHLKKPGIHDAAKRNTIRLFQFIQIPKRFQGKVADICFEYLRNRKEAVAIRVFSMTVLAQIARQHPELKDELRIVIEDQLPYSTAAFTNRGRKTLRGL